MFTVQGFISKPRTEALLKAKEPHTFLLRFSDSTKGKILGHTRALTRVLSDYDTRTCPSQYNAIF